MKNGHGRGHLPYASNFRNGDFLFPQKHLVLNEASIVSPPPHFLNGRVYIFSFFKKKVGLNKF